MLDLDFITTVGFHLRYELLFSVLLALVLVLSPDAWAKVTGKKESKKGEQTEPKDAVALAAHIADLSSQRYGKAMDLFTNNTTLLLELDTELVQVCIALGVASVRVGRCDRLPVLFKALRGKDADGTVLVHVLRVLASKQQHAHALTAAEQWQTEVSSAPLPNLALSCLVQGAVELRKAEDAERFFAVLTTRTSGATARDYSAMIRLYSAQAMPERAHSMLERMKQAGLQPDSVAYNMVLAASTDHQSADVTAMLADMDADIVTYNTRLRACVKTRDVGRALALLAELEQKNIAPTEVTFGTLVDVCTRAGDLDSARQVLKRMEHAQIPKNTIVYTSMLRGLAAAGKLKEAMEVFAEQNAAGNAKPDIICYSVLIKGHCDSGDLDTALQLLEKLLQAGHVPDEILFNSLLAGCAQKPHVQLGEQLLQDMVKHIRPTMATFSILLKMYTKAGAFQQSAQLLEQMPTKYGVVPAARLYVQHVSWCIRLRRGSSALQVYKLMLARCPECPDMDQFLTACASFNMLDTAASLLEVEPRRFSPAAIADIHAVIARKKPQLAARLRK